MSGGRSVRRDVSRTAGVNADIRHRRLLPSTRQTVCSRFARADGGESPPKSKTRPRRSGCGKACMPSSSTALPSRCRIRPRTRRSILRRKRSSPAWACRLPAQPRILSLATAAVLDLADGPYLGKETGETALLRQMLGSLHPGDVAVMDRYFCSFLMIALLLCRGVQVCAECIRNGTSTFAADDAWASTIM